MTAFFVRALVSTLLSTYFENATLLPWLVFLSFYDLDQRAVLSILFYERGASLEQVIAQLHTLKVLRVEKVMAGKLL